MSVHNLSASINYISNAKATVFFGSATGGASEASAAPLVEKMQTNLDIFPWGEDNRFPQSVVEQIAQGSPMQSSLNIKAKSLWGGGVVYGKLVDGAFVKAQPGDYPDVDAFFLDNDIPRFYAELNQDYVYFANCFPELIFTKDRTKIARLIHQESCDCRFKQMDSKGNINIVYLSKMWGASKDQLAKFDSKKELTGRLATYTSEATPDKVDDKFVKKRYALDPYFPMDGLKMYAEKKESSVILPVNYPSPNKTYYQLPHWDAVRQSGWIEIATQIPNMLKTMYNNAFNIKYHIEIPETYLQKRVSNAGKKWGEMTPAEKQKEKELLLKSMDDFLSGTDNAHKSLITFFTSDVEGREFERIKITPIEHKSNIDKDLLASGTANSELLFALEMNPNMIGAGKPGGVYSSNQGGSNIREAKTAHDMLLNLDRHMTLAPLRVIARYNGWPKELIFRHEDIEMTTLDTGKETVAKTS
ncbi:MAG: hypothetical protein IPJ31_10510 [Bacteroidetes bacterium]|nr:hypothetical protein [Bacteroidota bacterium]